MLINRGRGYTNIHLLLKAERAQWPEAHLKLVEDKANRTGCDPVITA